MIVKNLDVGFRLLQEEKKAIGPVYAASKNREFFAGNDLPEYKREISLLDTKGGVDGAPYFEGPKPQYEGHPACSWPKSENWIPPIACYNRSVGSTLIFNKETALSPCRSGDPRRSICIPDRLLGP